MAEKKEEKKICGIVMPISAIDGCPESHWQDVYSILEETIDDAGFEANLVSNADDIGLIHKRIIQNLYDNPIVVCDVSCKNPNVMFELGMRLAFDKPTIIIKDNKTGYSFDTSSIEHLEYPRDLRFTDITEFKRNLKDKIINTYNASINSKGYTTFLKHFGDFKVAKINTEEVSSQEYILEELKYLRGAIGKIEKNRTGPTIIKMDDDITLRKIRIMKVGEKKESIINILEGYPFDIRTSKETITVYGRQKYIDEVLAKIKSIYPSLLTQAIDIT